MTTRSSVLHSLVQSPFEQAVMRWLTLTIVASACLLLVSGCVALFRSTTPVLYKPMPCDLRPVLNMPFPEHIDTLAGVPRTETVFQNGTNKFGGRLPDEIKEQFYFKKGTTEYTFIVFYSEAAAIKKYGRYSDRNVFRETTEDGLAGRVHYTEEPRADPEGGSVPMGYYISRADFRLHNLYIRVETKGRAVEGEKPQNDKLSKAVDALGQMLKESPSLKQAP